MKIIHKLMCIALLMLSPHLLAEVKEVLKPVSDVKASKIETYNESYLKKLLYFSIRHRIVEVNTDLLVNSKIDDVFSFSPFDDLDLLLKTIRIKAYSNDRASWTGKIQVPASYIDKVNQLTPEERQGIGAEEFLTLLTSVNLIISTWDIDRDTGEALIANSKRAEKLSPSPIEVQESRGIERNAFQSVRGAIPVVTTGQKFYIVPLKYSPKYHVIYEVDQSKTYATGNDIPGEEPTRTSEDNRRSQLHKAFLDSLPKKESDTDKQIKGDIK